MSALIAAVISGAAVVATACITQWKTKQLQYFQTYFSEKRKAYAEFWEALADFEMFPTPEHDVQLTAKLHTVALFSPDEVYHQALSAAAHLKEHRSLDGSKIEALVDAMRRDLEDCKRMKFD